ncbi:hypothetical protein [Streptomyces sp. NPDC057496]|uniref:hypothetical protein n=1 Tax=Streptomyces sp. NPDC057496 TaxID=3346149 RepID=UPI0036A2ACC9
MSTDSTSAVDLTELRRAELARREERRRARADGAIPALSARRRGALNGRDPRLGTDVSTDFGTPVPERADPPPLSVSPRTMAVLERAAAEVGKPGFPEEALLRASRVPNPERALAADVCELLDGLAPLSVLSHLADLTAAGLPVLREDERVRAEAIASGRLPLPDTAPGTVDAWQLHLEASEAQGCATLSTEAWQRLVEQLPLPVVDDLIDKGKLRHGVGVHSLPRQSDRARYVTARLAPEELSDAEVAELEWRDESCRRTLQDGGTIDAVDGRQDPWSLRSALLDGETAALDSVEPYVDTWLPADLAALVAELKEVRRGGPVEWRTGQDASLFGVLEDYLPSGRLISGNTAFHYWAGTRRMYRLLDDVHWALACDPDDVADAVKETTRQAMALRNLESRGAAGRADREARVVLAYVCFLGARPHDRDRLDQGVGLLEEILKRGRSRRGGVGGEQRRRMAKLSDLLQHLRLSGKTQDVLNPYLALCVEHGSGAWRQGWRDLRNQVAPEQLEYINGAKDRVQRLETARRTGEWSETVYALPLDERFLWVPDARNAVLLPDPQPLERRTGASTGEEAKWTAAQAAREIVGRCAGRLRNDY